MGGEEQSKQSLISLLSCLDEETQQEDDNTRTYENAVTLYEDKKYYPDAEEVVLFELT